jgi:uncharacterized protein
LLFLSTYAAYATIWIGLNLILYPNTIPIPKVTNSATFVFVILVSLLNPLFEETFVVGYLFDKLQGKGLLVFIIISTLIRTSYHLYQGWVGVVSITPMGLIFAFTYYKYKNLMPLYLSHALMDLTGLVFES